jgi:hypothetical protein
MLAFSEKHIFPVAYEILSKLKVKNCHHVYKLKGELLPAPEGTNIIHHHGNDLYYSTDYIDEVEDELIPLDEKLLNQLCPCEVKTLRMMDRLVYLGINPHFEYLDYGYRKYMYLKQVRYWNHVLEDEKIELVIFGNVPHCNYDYIIYHLVKLKNIPKIIMKQSNILDFTFFWDNYSEPSKELQETYQKMLDTYRDTPIEGITLPSGLNEYFISHAERSELPTPFYMEQFKIKKGLVYKLKTLLRIILRIDAKHLAKRSELFKVFSKKFADLKLNKYYDSIITTPDYNKKFFYVALHYQPELTTNPLGGEYVDQRLIVQMLSKLIPDDYLIYIKEHPNQKSFCRGKELYDDLLKLKNVRFVSKKEKSYDLLRNCVAVVTCTGTVGLEAIFWEIPVLIFGDTYYQYINGTFRIKTTEDCRNALNQILVKNVKPSVKDMKIFLKALDTVGFHAYYDTGYKINSQLSFQENNKVFIHKVLERLNKMFPDKELFGRRTSEPRLYTSV